MDPVEAFRMELGERLAQVVARFPTKGAAAQAAGITAEQLNKWLAGTVKVPVDGLWRLARVGRVDFRWLCAGGEPASGELHADVMREVLAAMIGATQQGDVVFASPDKFAGLAMVLHDYVVAQRAKQAPVDLGEMGKIIQFGAR